MKLILTSTQNKVSGLGYMEKAFIQLKAPAAKNK